MDLPDGMTESEAMRPYALSLALLRDAGLRPTRQRLSLAKQLYTGVGHRHVTAEQLHEEVLASGFKVSLATVYNTLHQFTLAGLLRELVVEPGHVVFDTNVSDHHHFYNQQAGRLTDIETGRITVGDLPAPPAGERVLGVHVVVYTGPDASLDRP